MSPTTREGYGRLLVILSILFFMFPGVFTVHASEPIHASGILPSTFDLRNVSGNCYVSEVRSQKGGTCWTHATMAAIESNMMVTGLWEKVESDPEPDLAEYHLDWWNGFNNNCNDDRDPPNGSGLWVHYGGDYLIGAAYLSRGDGAVRDKDGQNYGDPPERNLPQYHRYCPMDIEWYHMDDDLNGIESIKQAIMDNGAVATCINADPNLRDKTFAHWQPPEDEREPNHAVTIVGWDDDKTTPAPKPGAWLVKNSWGTLWGNDGYFWVSYYDKWACRHPQMGAVSFRNISYLVFDHALYHDYHGWRDTWTNSTEAFNRYVIEEDEQMQGVSFYTTADDVDVIVSVWDDYMNGSLKSMMWKEEKSYRRTGLHTIMFGNPLELFRGDDIYIKLNVSGGGIAFDRTSQVPVLLDDVWDPGFNSWVTSKSAPNQSFYLDGGLWRDLYYFNQSSNFCIKGLVGHVSITSPREGGHLGRNFTASGPVSDQIDSVRIRIDDGPERPSLIVHGKWGIDFRDLSLSPGRHRLTTVATQDGCEEVVSTTFVDFFFDDDPPVLEISLDGSSGENGWFRGPVNMTLSATDASSWIDRIEYLMDGMEMVTYNGTVTIREDGEHIVAYHSIDTTGNVEGLRAVRVRIDSIPCNSSIVLQGRSGEGGYYISPVTCYFGSTDITSGVEHIDVWVDGKKTDAGLGKSIMVDAAGEHNISFRGSDIAGNIEQIKWRNFVVDLLEPETEMEIMGIEGEDGWFLSNVSIQFHVRDDQSGVNETFYRFEGGNWQQYMTPILLGKEGQYQIQYRSGDRAGHQEAVREGKIMIDTSSPVTKCTIQGDTGDNSIYISGVYVDIQAEDAGSGVISTFWRMEGGSWRVYDGPVRCVKDGDHALDFFSEDAAGNKEMIRTLNFRLDLEDPFVGLMEDLEWKLLNSTRIVLTPVYGDPDGYVKNVDFSLDGNEWIEVQEDRIVLENLEDGIHIFRVRARDTAGRTADYKATFLVNRSITFPDPSAEAVENEENGSFHHVFSFLIIISLSIIFAGICIVAVIVSMKIAKAKKGRVQERSDEAGRDHSASADRGNNLNI